MKIPIEPQMVLHSEFPLNSVGTIQSNRSHHAMIASNNVNSFLQILSLEDNSLQLNLFDWQENEMELVPI
jgi:hypothetical protein